MLNHTAAHRCPGPPTFHGFCFGLFKDVHAGEGHSIIDDYDRKELVAEAHESVRHYIRISA
ncbi:MAG: hypothetical protein R2861_13950 [Desulfobacterales bacterium]